MTTETTYKLPPTSAGPFSLKAVKEHKDMSEETMCFSATLLKNGVPIASVENRGTGGQTDIHPLEGGWAALQPIMKELEDEYNKLFPDDPSGEAPHSLMDVLAENVSLVKELKRKAKQHTVFILPGEDVAAGYRFIKASPTNPIVQRTVAAQKGIVLNDLIEKAVA